MVTLRKRDSYNFKAHYSFIYRSISSQPIMNHTHICRRARRIRGPLRHSCRREPEVMAAVINGSRLAMAECRAQFRHHRWNCTHARKAIKRTLMRGNYYS